METRDSSDAASLARRIEHATDPEHCDYGPSEHINRTESYPRIIVSLRGSEWRQVVKALRSAHRIEQLEDDLHARSIERDLFRNACGAANDLEDFFAKLLREVIDLPLLSHDSINLKYRIESALARRKLTIGTGSTVRPGEIDFAAVRNAAPQAAVTLATAYPPESDPAAGVSEEPAVAAPEAGREATAGTPSPTEVHPMKIETWLDHQTKTTEAHISDNGGNLKDEPSATARLAQKYARLVDGIQCVENSTDLKRLGNEVLRLNTFEEAQSEAVKLAHEVVEHYETNAPSDDIVFDDFWDYRLAQAVLRLSKRDSYVPAREGWVSVEDRLPPAQRMVLMACPESQRAAVQYGFLDYAQREFMTGTTGGWEPVRYTGKPVTHWMPLPAAPEAKP